MIETYLLHSHHPSARAGEKHKHLSQKGEHKRQYWWNKKTKWFRIVFQSPPTKKGQKDIGKFPENIPKPKAKT